MQPGAFVNSDMPVGRMASPSNAYLCNGLLIVFVFCELCICIESKVRGTAHYLAYCDCIVRVTDCGANNALGQWTA